MKKVMKNEKKAVKPVESKKDVYTAISNNVYFTGYSYRARVTVDGKCNSKNFTSKRKAIQWRNQMRKVS